MGNNEQIDIWSKWDLHHHSPLSFDFSEDKCEEAQKCKSSLDYWTQSILKKWIENDIKMVSITDHNLLDYSLYQKMKTKAGEKGIELIPGIEIDASIPSKGSDLAPIVQFIIHINPKDLEKLWDGEKNSLNEFLQKNTPQGLTIDKLINFFVSSNIECNISVEGEKSKGIFRKIGEGQLGTKKKIVELFNVGHLSSTNDSSSSSIIQAKKKLIKWLHELNELIERGAATGNWSSFLASDNHCPSIYPKGHHDNKLGEISFFNGRNNFLGLCLSLNSQGNKIMSELPAVIASENKIKKIIFKNKNGQNYSVESSQKLNIIIGPRGAGKTLLLKFLNKYNNVEDTEVEKYNYFIQSTEIKLEPYESSIPEMEPDPRRIREFHQGEFIDPILENENPGKALQVNFSTETPQKLKDDLVRIYDFYTNYKIFIDSFERLITNKDLVFKDFSNLYTQEENWYLNFFKALESSLVAKEFGVEQLNRILEIALDKNKQIKSGIIEYGSHLKDYNEFVRQNKLEKLLLGRIDELPADSTLTLIQAVSHQEVLLQRHNRILTQLEKRLSTLNAAKMDFAKNVSLMMKENDKRKKEMDKKIDKVKNNFKSLGESLSEIKNEKISIEPTYEVKSKKDIPRSHYSLQPSVIFEPAAGDLGKSFQKVIYANFIALQKKNTAYELNTDELLDIEFLTRKLLKDAELGKVSGKIFKIKDLGYLAFQEKIFHKTPKLNITRSGKKVTESSTGEMAQVFFEIQMANLLEDEDRSIVLIDQPEDSIDNRYVADEMIGYIRRLIDCGKQVFLITHNPNIVINTFPDNIIIPIRTSEGTITYRNGRLEDEIMIGGKIKRIVDWVGDFVEGGKKAFFNRLLTYEMGWSNDTGI